MVLLSKYLLVVISEGSFDSFFATIEEGSFDSQFLIKECKFENNFAERGAGTMWFQGTHLTIEKCVFKNNVGLLNGDELILEYPRKAPENVKDYSYVMTENTFQRTVAESEVSSLIFFIGYNAKFKFSFTKNKVNINNDGKTVYLFGCYEDDKFIGSVADNFVTSSNKDTIVSDKFKDNQEAELDFDFDKDFQTTPSVPDDQITSESSCTVFNFEDPNPSVINNRCTRDGSNDDTTMINIIRTSFDHFTYKESGGAVHITNCGLKCKSATFKNCESSNGGGGAIYVKNKNRLANNVDLTKLTFVQCKAIAIFMEERKEISSKLKIILKEPKN